MVQLIEYNKSLINICQSSELLIKVLEGSTTFKNVPIQRLWDAVKAVLRGKYIAIQAYLKKQEKSQIQNLTAHLKEIEAEQQRHPKPSRRREIIKIRPEINNIESKTTVEQINETKSCFFEKIKKN